MAVTCIFLLTMMSSAYAAEEPTHLFDPNLSLTGDCTTTTLDPVPDPGCPSGVHPPQAFASVTSSATDPHGDVFVASSGVPVGGAPNGTEGWIDVFSPQGKWITEIQRPGARYIAVDSEGHLYVVYKEAAEGHLDRGTVRFDPSTYNPASEEIIYEPTEHPVDQNYGGGIAVNPQNDHLYVNVRIDAPNSGHLVEYSSAATGNVILDEAIDIGTRFIAVDGAHHRLFVVKETGPNQGEGSEVQILESEAPHALVGKIDGTNTPAGKFLNKQGGISVAAMESNGHVFVDDIERAGVVYEFDGQGNYVAKIKRGFEYVFTFSEIGIDNGKESPNNGYLFVPSRTSANSHLYAFAPIRPPTPPVVESLSFDGVTRSEAVLHATINPEGAPTHYVFEYTSLQSFEEEEFAGAIIAGEGDLEAATSGAVVSAPLFGLASGQSYRFRVRAESQCEPGGCRDEAGRQLSTFAAAGPAAGCPNQALRTGPSAMLPDCRAYELVTPSNTNGRQPYAAAGSAASFRFATPSVSADGSRLSFLVIGGVIPGQQGAGGFNGDSYLSSRTGDGWQTTSQTPSGAESSNPVAGGLSSDLEHIVWSISSNGGGSLLVNGQHASYLRSPDGSYRLIGEGSQATDLDAALDYIAPGGSHAYFSSSVQLEPQAPPTGTIAIYDLLPDGTLRVTSLLTEGDEDVTPTGHALYLGSSADGSALAFNVNGSAIYLRLDDQRTVVAAPAGSAFAGLSADGGYLFYRSAGDLYRFDSQEEVTARITESGDTVPVNVSSDGEGIYFLSPSTMGEGPNPLGADPVPTAKNLYYWDGAQTHFIATVTQRDAEGEPAKNGGFARDGLELWLSAIEKDTPAIVPSRTNPTGASLLFQSRANLTGFDSSGKSEIYHYDAATPALKCISCDPTGAEPGSDAKLATVEGGIFSRGPVNPFSQIPNLSRDGKRAFFETSERLVPEDNDQTQDVYEWEAEGKGSCTSTAGCLFLISSGQSAQPNYLWGASQSGDDVFFSTSDLLLAADPDETPSVYDARVEGGFPQSSAGAGECAGEACQPAANPPGDPAVALRGAGNVPAAASCPKGKRQVRKAGRSRCVARHKKHVHKRGRRGAARKARGSHR